MPVNLSKATVGSAWRRRDGVKVVCEENDGSGVPFRGSDGHWREVDGSYSEEFASMGDIIAPWHDEPQEQPPAPTQPAAWSLRDEVAMRLFVGGMLDHSIKWRAEEIAEVVFRDADIFMAERAKRPEQEGGE